MTSVKQVWGHKFSDGGSAETTSHSKIFPNATNDEETVISVGKIVLSVLISCSGSMNEVPEADVHACIAWISRKIEPQHYAGIGAIWLDCNNSSQVARAILRNGLTGAGPSTIDPSILTLTEQTHDHIAPIKALFGFSRVIAAVQADHSVPIFIEPKAHGAAMSTASYAAYINTINRPSGYFPRHMGAGSTAQLQARPSEVSLIDGTVPPYPEGILLAMRHDPGEVIMTDPRQAQTPRKSSSTSGVVPAGVPTTQVSHKNGASSRPGDAPNQPGAALEVLQRTNKTYSTIYQPISAYSCSSYALIALRAAMFEKRRLQAPPSALPRSPMSAKHRLTCIEAADSQAFLAVINKRYHVYHFWQDHPSAAASGSFYTGQHNERSDPRQKRRTPGNPLAIRDGLVNTRLTRELCPDTDPEDASFKETYNKIKLLRKLGLHFHKIVGRFGKGILALLPGPEQCRMPYPSMMLTDATLCNLSMTDLDQVLDHLDKDHGAGLRRFSLAVEPILEFLIGDHSLESQLLLERTEAEKIVAMPNRSSELLSLTAPST